MGKSAPPPPATPDYKGAAKEQGIANLEAARLGSKLSNPNMYTPYGNQLISYDGDQPTIRQTLTPEAQRTLDEQQKVQYQLASLSGKGANLAGNVLDKAFSFGGPDVKTSLDLSNVAKMPVNAGTTGMEAIMSRLEPSLRRNRVSTETNLINQGLRPGTEAYDNAARLLGESENDQRTQAALQGINLDTAANAQGYNQALQGGQFENTAQQQALAEAIQLRNMPLNEITALMSGSQIQNPQFGAYSGSNVTAAPTFAATQAQGQAEQNNYNQQVATQNANTAGLYGLGAAGVKGLVMSDVRLKSNIVKVGDHPIGIGIYEYDIFGQRERGVIAQELMQVMPDAVHQHPSGYLMVDYGRL
jgi:hypothetical protein